MRSSSPSPRSAEAWQAPPMGFRIKLPPPRAGEAGKPPRLDSRSRLATQPARRFVLNAADKGFSFARKVMTAAPELCMYGSRRPNNSLTPSHYEDMGLAHVIDGLASQASPLLVRGGSGCADSAPVTC